MGLTVAYLISAPLLAHMQLKHNLEPYWWDSEDDTELTFHPWGASTLQNPRIPYFQSGFRPSSRLSRTIRVRQSMRLNYEVHA
jgi:hypothetical protein